MGSRRIIAAGNQNGIQDIKMEHKTVLYISPAIITQKVLTVFLFSFIFISGSHKNHE